MKVKLKEQDLKRIICEKANQMLPEWKLSRRTKRSKMFKDVDFAISKYKDSLMSSFVPVLIEDFGGTTSVKMTGMKMEKTEIDKIKEFGIKIGKSALESYRKDLEINVGRIIDVYIENQQNVGTLHDELGKIYNIIDRNHKFCYNFYFLHRTPTFL